MISNFILFIFMKNRQTNYYVCFIFLEISKLIDRSVLIADKWTLGKQSVGRPFIVLITIVGLLARIIHFCLCPPTWQRYEMVC
jgi:hypothetical protein